MPPCSVTINQKHNDLSAKKTSVKKLERWESTTNIDNSTIPEKDLTDENGQKEILVEFEADRTARCLRRSRRKKKSKGTGLLDLALVENSTTYRMNLTSIENCMFDAEVRTHDLNICITFQYTKCSNNKENQSGKTH